MRKYLVEPEEVDRLFPGKDKESQRRLLYRLLHLDVKYDEEDNVFLLWSRSLVRFTFEAELLPSKKDDPDVNVYKRKGCPLLPGVMDVFQRGRIEDRQEARRLEGESKCGTGGVHSAC